MRLAFLLSAFSLVTTSAFAGPNYVNEQYTLTPLSDGVYSFIAPESDSGVVQSNCTLIIGDDSVLLVDSGQFPSLAQRMVADTKKLTPKPVRYLVNTHWHFDHVWGNGTFRDAYPGLAIISTEFTRELVESEGPKTINNQPNVNRDQAAQYRKAIADGKFPNGPALDEEQKQFLTRLAGTLEHINAEFPNTTHVPPTIGFDKTLTINLGKRTVQVLWLGRANTGGDAIIWLPDSKILLTGDTVVYPAPFAFGSYLSEWPVTLQKMIDLHPDTIIPGHGPVMHDTTYIQTLIEMFQALTTQVNRAVADKLTLAEIHKKVTLSAFEKRLAGDDPMRIRDFRGGFLYPAIDRAYQEATGTLKAESMYE
jgi:cyclase